MKKNKTFLSAICRYRWFVVLTIILLILSTSIFLWIKDVNKNAGGQTKVLTGLVTSKKPGGLVDAGDFLYVDGELVRTSNKKSLHSGSTFHIDTSSIKKGDKVEVGYIEDIDGKPTLNCSSCYIRKLD